MNVKRIHLRVLRKERPFNMDISVRATPALIAAGIEVVDRPVFYVSETHMVSVKTRVLWIGLRLCWDNVEDKIPQLVDRAVAMLKECQQTHVYTLKAGRLSDKERSSYIIIRSARV